MSGGGLNIPQIAITESNELNSIADALTEIEDLEETDSNQIKSKLKIKLGNNGATTDVEDLDTSDSESGAKNPSVCFDDLHLDTTHSQESLTANSRSFQTYEVKSHELSILCDDDGLTDAENFVTDEEPEPDLIPDADINFHDYRSDVNISNTEALILPSLDTNQLTDVESVDSDQELVKKTETKRRKSKSNKSRTCYPKIKKSMSHPVLNKSEFDSDGDIQTNFRKLLLQTHKDVSDDSTASEVDFGAISDPEEIEFVVDDLNLPPPVRSLILLLENKSVVPTTKILPLDETRELEGSVAGGGTDVEFYEDDDVLVAGYYDYKRGPTPDIYQLEDSSIHYGEDQLDVNKENVESVTDTEDLAIADHTKRIKKSKNKFLSVARSKEPPTTDVEDFYDSDSAKSPMKKQNKTYNMKEIDSTIISSRDSDGTLTTTNLLNVERAEATHDDGLTDVEDLVTSDDEDVRPGTATPNEFARHLEQQRSSKVYIESTKKINLDSPNEIMYLKGGSYYQSHTDVEEMSDDTNEREWDVAKKSAAAAAAAGTQEEAPLAQDAEQQATPNYVTYESVLLRPDRDSSSSPTTSYKQIDDMLEKMLCEVEEQEKLFSLDLDILEPKDDSFVNTLELVPETDALIEIPIKKSKVFESYREIVINDDLIDLQAEEDDGYEPIEYNALTHAYQRFDSYPEDNVWFEGTYRNLSIVPEEDEDESVSLLSSYSNYRTQSTSSNQYSYLNDSSDSTDDSDLDERFDKNESIVKAEVKLLVKTTDRGKEAIEIRSVREFLENPPETSKPAEVKKKSHLGDKITSLKNKFSSIVGRRNFILKPNETESREDLLEEGEKPSFTFQQLFVRTPEPIEGGLQEAKRFGSRTELVASSSERFPLVYDPEDGDVSREIGNVDLHANIPFFPCYNRSDSSQYGFKALPSPHTNPFTETISNPFNESDQIPRAYCDWLEDDNGGGLPTTTERLVASNEETLLDKPLGQQLTGLSVIDDYLVTDLKTVCEQTNAFIQSESQPEPYDALADKLTRKEPINDKKVDDNKNNVNEKKKAKKGFFGSIKTFVERSFESDSESEKSPKKSKKPKKEKKKKSKEDKQTEQGLPPRKPKLPTPPLEPSDIDSIPYAEASVSDLPPPYKPPDVPMKEEQIPVTDLDDLKPPAEPEEPKVEIKTKDKVKDKKKPKSKTIVFEEVTEVTKRIEPLVIEAEEFSIVVDPTKKESPKKSKEIFTVNIDESIEKIEKEIMEKSPILTEEKIVKPLAAIEMQNDAPIRPPRIRDHVYEDIESPPLTIPQDQVKDLTTDLIQNEINFGGWADVATPDKAEKEGPLKEIVEKQDKEVSKEKDEAKKKGGFFGLFKKKDSKKEEDAQVKVEEIEPATEKIEKESLSETVLKDIADSNKFLSDEVQNYHDVRPVSTETESEVSAVITTTTTTTTKPEVEEPKAQSEGFFGLFKKPKKDEKSPEKKLKKSEEKKVTVLLSEEVLKNMFDSKRFLEDEVQNYHDVKSVGEVVKELVEEKAEPKKKTEDKTELSPKKVSEEKAEPSPKSSPGFFGRFKKSKKEEAEVSEAKVSDEVIKDIQDTDQFIAVEVEKYHDVKPVQEKISEAVKKVVEEKPELSPSPKKKTEPSPKKDLEERRESSPKPAPGFFGIFKKSKKEEIEAPEGQVPLSDEVVKDMQDTDQFLIAEVENYHDVKPIVEKVSEVVKEPPSKKIVEEKAAQSPSPKKKTEPSPKKILEEGKEPKASPGFLGIFKKSKKEEVGAPEAKVILSDEVAKDMEDTDQFLITEVENYHDVKPIPEKIVEVVKELPFKEIAEEKVEQSPSPKKKTEPSPKKILEEGKEPKASPGFLGIFKKSKKEEVGAPEAKAVLSDEVAKDMEDTDQFLIREVENYHDVKPIQEKILEVVEESPPKKIVEAKPEESLSLKKKTQDKTESSPKKGLEEGRESSPGFFGRFKKSKKEGAEGTETKVFLPEEVVNDMIDTDAFLITEVENYHDVKPIEEKIVDVVKELPSKKLVEEKPELSPSPKKKADQTEPYTKKDSEERRESSPGFFGFFKKSKKEGAEEPETKVVFSDEVVKDMRDTDEFLITEVEKYHDVKPIQEKIVEVVKELPSKKIVEEKPELSPSPKKKTTEDKTEPCPKKDSEERRESSPGFFGIFKKSKKEEVEVIEPKVVLSQELVKDIKDTDTFLITEVENYHDVKPIPEKIVEVVKELPSKKLVEEKPELSPSPTKKTEDKTVPSPKKDSEERRESSPGFFGFFKKSKKEEVEIPEAKVILSDVVAKDMKDTDEFLITEVENYHDVKPIPEKIVELVKEIPPKKIVEEKPELSPSPKKKTEDKTEPSPKKDSEERRESSPGFFGFFKKSKKEEIEIPETKVMLSDEVAKDMKETDQFLIAEVENYHDVKPIVEKVSEVVKESPSKKIAEEKLELSPSPKKKTEDKTEPSPKKHSDEKRESSPGFFDRFKKSKKGETEGPELQLALSEEVIKDIKETDQFLIAEVENYHDVKPQLEEKKEGETIEVVKTVTEAVKSQPREVQKKEDEIPPFESQLSEATLKGMADSNQFLTDEVQNYHDVRPVLEKAVEGEKVTESAEPPSSGFFGLFKKTKKEGEKIVPEVDTKEVVKETEIIAVQDEKIKKVAEEVRESSPKPSAGFFGLFKKSKKDEEETVPAQTPLSDSVLQDMSDTNQFLQTEVETYHDVKPETFEALVEEITQKVEGTVDSSPKSKRLFGIFKKSSKEDSPTLAETVEKEIDDTKELLTDEVVEEKLTKAVEDGVEASAKSSRGLFGIFKKTKKEQEETHAISEVALQAMNDTNLFLTGEVDNYHDVKPEKFDAVAVKTVEEASPKTSRGLLGKFKKPKKEQEEQVDIKPVISESVQKDIIDTDTFLSVEVENYQDSGDKVSKIEDVETSVKPTKGLFGIFKKSKKDEEEAIEAKVAEEVADTTQVVAEIVEEKVTEVVEKTREASPRPTSGIFGIFKKSKKEEEEISDVKVPLSETVQKSMEDTKQFLEGEVEKYHDVKPEKSVEEDKGNEEEVESSSKSRGLFGIFKKPTDTKVTVLEEKPEEAKIVVEQKVSQVAEKTREASPRPTSGIFNIFKKSKKDDEEDIPDIKITLAETVQKSMDDTQEFLDGEVERYQDVKPVSTDEVKSEPIEEIKQGVEETKVGFLAKFKKTKKKPASVEAQLSEEAQKVIDETKNFITTEFENYEDAKVEKPEKDKKEEKSVTFDGTKSQMVLEGHLPQPEVPQVVEVVKTEVVDLVDHEAQEVQDVVSEELSEVQQAIEIQEAKPKKDKKDKKGFFNIFGKKSKSQEQQSFEESRGRSEEESESPKKQKRRKSSSPFKFFEKMKKSEEEVKEVEEVLQVEPVAKEETKDDLLSVEFEGQPAMNLTDEVLDSLEKKMEELKSKYPAEAQKQMNDCRDFLFIEVDNYEDAKPVVVTDIDTGITTDASKAVNDIIDKAAKVVEGKVEKDTTETVATKLISDVEESTKKAATKVEKEAAETVTEVEASSKKAAKKAQKKSGGFFSKLGSMISSGADEAKGELKEARKSAEKAIDKAKESTEKVVDVTVKSAEEAAKKVKDKVDGSKKEAKEIKDSALETASEKIDELDKTKDTAVDATVKKMEEAKEGVMDLKGSLLEVKAKAGSKIDGLKKDAVVTTQAVTEKAIEAKDATVKKVDDVKESALSAAEKTKAEADKIAIEAKTKAEDAVAAGTKQIEDAADRLDKAKEEAKTKAQEAVVAGVKQTEDAADRLDKAKKDAIDLTTKKMEQVKTEAQEVTQKGKDKALDTSAKVVGVFEKAKHEVTDQVTKKAESVKEASTSVLDAADKAKTDVEAKAEQKLGDIRKGAEDITKATAETKDRIVEDLTEMKQSTREVVGQNVEEVGKTKDSILISLTTKVDEVGAAAAQKIDNLEKVKESAKETTVHKIEKLQETKERVATAAEETKHEAEDLVVQKIEELKKTKASVESAAAVKVEELKGSVSQKVEDLQRIKEDAEVATAKKADDVTVAAAQKLDELAAVGGTVKDKAAQKVDDFAKTKESVQEAATSKAEDFAKLVTKKTDDVVKVKETIKEAAAQKVEDFSKVQKKTGDLITEALYGVGDSAKQKSEEVSGKIVDAKEITSQKLTDFTTTASQRIQDSTARMTENLTKAVTGKIDGVAKAKEDMKEAGAQRAEELSKVKEKTEDFVAAKLHDFGKLKDVAKDATERKSEEILKATVEAKATALGNLEGVREAAAQKATVKAEEFTNLKDSVRDATEKTAVGIKEKTKQKVEDLSKAASEKADDLAQAKKSVEDSAAAKTKELTKLKGAAEDSVTEKWDDFTRIATARVEEFAKPEEGAEDAVERKSEEVFKAATDTKTEMVQKLDDLDKSFAEKSAKGKQGIEDAATKKSEELSKLKEEAERVATKKTDDLAKIKKSVEGKVEDVTKVASERVAKTKEALRDATVEKAEHTSKKVKEAKLKESAIEDLIKIEKGAKDTSAQIVDVLSKKTVQKIDDFTKTKQSAIDDLSKIKDGAKDSKDEVVKEVSDSTKKALEDLDKIGKSLAEAGTSGLDKTKSAATKRVFQAGAQEKSIEEKMAEVDDELAKLTSSLEQLSEPAAQVKSYVTSPTMARRAESQRFSREERPLVREIRSTQANEDSDEESYVVTEPEEKEKKRKPLFHIESEEDDLHDLGKERRDSVKSNVLETLTENNLDNLLSDLEVQLVKDLETSVTDDKEKIESKIVKADVELEALTKDSQADVEQIEQKLRDLDKALDSLEQASDPKLEKKLHRVERKFERMASEVMEVDVSGASPTEAEARREHEFQRLVSQLSTEEVSDFQKEYGHLWDETTFSKSDEWDSKTPDSQVDVQELPQGEVVYMGPVTLNKDNLINKAGVEVEVIPIMRSPCHTPRLAKKNKRAKSALDFYEESPPREFDRGSLPDLKRTSTKGSLVSTIIHLNPERFLYGSVTSLRSTASSSSDLSRGEIMNAVLDWLDKSNRTNESSVETASIASSDSNLSQLSAKIPTIRISKGKGKKRANRRETTSAPTLTEELKTIPQPKPRFAKETPLHFKEGRQPPKLEKQISPVRDDLLDEEEHATYSDKKKFWENVTKEKRTSLTEISAPEKDLSKKRASVHEVPVPKPRSQVQITQSIDEVPPSEEEIEEKIMSEYQASFQVPSERKTKSPPKVESDKESTDSESDAALSGTNENAGYISDSGDVEQYISDSEIEDRVPQIRERQMSVFAPPVAAARKTIYERSASLPTEDLYEVSARSIKLRKQYYEEQIKKEMIEEQLTSEIEEEPSPERKTLITSLVQQLSEEKARDLVRSFDETTKKEVSFEDDSQSHKPDTVLTHIEDQTAISEQIQETHKEIDVDTQKRSSLGSEQDSSSDMDRVTRNGSTSKPDSMEVHVDKSEIEDSEKLAELDQDVTDLETKSLDSLDAVEMSPKSATFVDDGIPEITVTLSGTQRRISEESDEYAPKPELDSPIHVPEEHVEDTVWEVSVQSQPEARFDEKVTTFDTAVVEKIEKEDDLSMSTRDESDLGSEIHQDHSDSYASDKIKSESHSDIERIIMDSLQQQKVDPVEAKAIASALIEEIEAEIQRRECLPPTTTTGDVSDYLKYLAETKGLDEREVELVESVLARRQRELSKLSRADTQASSIEITDEDLRYSGTESDGSHLLEQQISQLKAEKIDDIKSMSFLNKIDEKQTEESHSSKDTETVTDGVFIGQRSELHTKTFESIKGEKSETNTILEEDETVSESTTHDEIETRVEAIATEETHKKSSDKEVDEYRESTIDVSVEKVTEAATKLTEEAQRKTSEDTSRETDVTKSIIKHQIDLSEKSPTEELKLKGEITCEDYASKEESSKKETTTETKEIEGGKVEKEEAVEKLHTKTVEKEVVDEETEEKYTHKDEDSTIKQSKISSKVTSTDVVRESTTSTEVTEKVEVVDFLPSDLTETKTIIEKHEEIKRTSSSESKSSIESGKSPEDQFSTCSSGRKGDSDSSKVVPEVTMRKTTSLPKADRKSGIDFEAYSSSGESHYHSFELDSAKSRPCSSDVEGLVAAGSSEYESALTSQEYSARSHTEYHTAVSSLSSKESMKSLDSESSGHLGSVEVSELSETLVPSASDAEGDILDVPDDDAGWPEEVIEEPQSKMKRSHEMTFQPEPKLLMDSPQTDEIDRKFTSLDDGSILSLSSTSGTEPRTVIELSRADSERLEGGSMSVSGISDQLSIEGSCDSLVFHPSGLTTIDMSTSTGQCEGNLQIESITITTSTVNEGGIRSVSTQVISESQSSEAERKSDEIQANGKCPPEIKKKSHRRQESSSFIPPIFDQKFQSDLTESDKYTAELSFKEVISDEKKDIDEREKEESYETEADQGFHRDIREGKYQETEEENKDDTAEFSSETQASVGELEQEYTSALARAQEAKKKSETSPDLHIHKEPLEKRDSHSTSSEKSSFEEAEAEAAFNMVAHVSPAHKIKQICPILEDEDAEKHELETRERAQKEYEKRRSQMKDQSPGSIPDIKVTQHMTPLVDRNFRYPDLELEEQEREKEKEKESEETQKSTPQTPSSKSSEDTDQGREYVLEDSGISIPEEQATDSKSTVIEQTVKDEADKDTDSPNSDSFEMLEKPDLIDDFVVIEEVGKEAQEFDSEGKSVSIKHKGPPKRKKHDEEVEAYLTKSAPTPLTRMTDVKFYPDGSSSEELGFDFEDSPPVNNEASASSYEKELEANKKWIEQQFQGDQAARMAAGYDYEMEFERGPLEDIKEEDINDFDPSSRIGSLGSQKESGGSLGSVKDSYSSTPEYDVLAGRKYFTRSGEHDDISMSSLQEFENLERAMSLENKRHHQGSQDSSSNGSFKTRYYANKAAQGDDVSVSSLKEFEGLEMACIAAHKVEVKAKEEEAMLAQIDEGQESLASESESCETVSRTDKKIIPDSDEEDYEKRMFEIDEIIRQAQSNVERFIDLKEADKTESLGRGDSIEEVSKVPDLDLDAPVVRSTVKVQWKEGEDVMVTSTDSIDGKVEEKGSQQDSPDSLDQKTCGDVMTASTDSIEFQLKKTEREPINLLSDSIEIRDEKDEACGSMITSDSLELGAKMLESTDSLVDPSSSTATHATYQYETDSVFSGSFTSGGSNTMVSSTDTIDPVQVDIAAAARKVWFEEDSGTSRQFTTEYIQDTGKPYVTEVIEPSEDDSFSHTIHRRVELPPEVRKITFHGTDADERLRQFIEDFNEGEQVEEFEEVDAAGNVHTRKVVQRRFIVRGEEGPEMEEFLKKTVASKTNQLTSFPKETTGEESSFAATEPQDTTLRAQAPRRRQLRYEISIDDQIEVDPREHDWRFNLPEHAEGEEAASSGQETQQRPISDQHQLSEEMKQLLKDLEKESKQ